MSEFDNLVKIVGRWTITVEFEYDYKGSSIAASRRSKIRPLMLPDGSYDVIAVGEYEDFVINLVGVFERCDFEIISENKSPESYSHYFELVKKDQEQNKDYHYILFIRVSDHELSEDGVELQKKWVERRAEHLKQPKSKSKQRWKMKRIIVNKDTYFSYDEALEDLEDRLEAMR